MGREKSERGGLSVCLCVIPPPPPSISHGKMDIKDRKMGRSGLIRRASFLISGETGCAFPFYCGYPWKHCMVTLAWDLALSRLSLYVSPRPLLEKEKTNKQTNKQKNTPEPTGSPSSKYEHRHCCVTFEIKGFQYVEKTYRFCNLRKWKDFNKKQLTLHKMCVTSLLCGLWADLWPF